ncbi:MAG: hypothetical protein ABJB11_03280 [Ferruginibacter sp.]
MEMEENFSNNTEEQLRIENEILKNKLKAQFGDAFHMESQSGLPPDIENKFLKSVMAFEDEYARSTNTTVYERIGSPAVQSLDKISGTEIKVAVKNLITLLAANDIVLHINDGPYPNETIYRFITEELFAQQVEDKPVAGMGSNFIYEEFHPNHKADITKRTHTFLFHWFTREFNEYCTELSWDCISHEGEHLTREDIIAKMKIFFDAFEAFDEDGYNIDAVSFDIQDAGLPALGFAEGMLKYDAVMDNGEIIHYNGPYKLYMQLEDNWWSIFYFVMPGFKW